MGNEISIAEAGGNDFTIETAFNASRKFWLPTEILFEIFAFVKFYEAPNIFLVNRYFLQICEVYFHSGSIKQNKPRNIRYLTMELMEGLFTISVKRNGKWQSVPVPEVDPPKIFKAFGHIKIRKCCHIQAIQFFYKFQSLLTSEHNMIICPRNFFPNTANSDENKQQIDPNSPSNNEKQFFLNWIEQKKNSFGIKSRCIRRGRCRLPCR